MSVVSDLLLIALLNQGYFLLGSTLFLAALGIPLPASRLLIATGAFTRQGILGLESTATFALLGAVAGDGCNWWGDLVMTGCPLAFAVGSTRPPPLSGFPAGVDGACFQFGFF